MKKCKFHVHPQEGGISLYCSTCHEPVVWQYEWSWESLKATARGHKEVRARAREAYLAEKRRRFEEVYPGVLDRSPFTHSSDVPDYER